MRPNRPRSRVQKKGGMIVSVNGKQIDLFRGGTVRDALRAHSPSDLKKAEKREMQVFDRWGNPVDLDGELSGGEELRVK